MRLKSQMHLACKQKIFAIVVKGAPEPQSQLWSILVDGFSLLSLALFLSKIRIRYTHAN